LFGLLGGKSKQKYFTGMNQKKYFTEGKAKMTYITESKHLLTLNINRGVLTTTCNECTYILLWPIMCLEKNYSRLNSPININITNKLKNKKNRKMYF